MDLSPLFKISLIQKNRKNSYIEAVVQTIVDNIFKINNDFLIT